MDSTTFQREKNKFEKLSQIQIFYERSMQDNKEIQNVSRYILKVGIKN